MLNVPAVAALGAVNYSTTRDSSHTDVNARAIHRGMPTPDENETRRRDRRGPRPRSQAAQLLLRMSPEDRQLVHDLAATRGQSAAAYVLDLVHADEGRRACSQVTGDVDTVTTINNSTHDEAPGPGRDRAPRDAEARRAVATAAG